MSVDPSHYKAPFDIVYLVTSLSLYIYLEISHIGVDQLIRIEFYPGQCEVRYRWDSHRVS